MNVRRRLNPRTAGAILAAGLPALVACVLAVIWVDSHRLRLFGDEPHYVIIAESITRDADFELRNNYALEARFPQVRSARSTRTSSHGATAGTRSMAPAWAS